MSDFWNARFSEEGFAYGDQPNDFLVEVAGLLPRGKALCIAEGEGRNAVFLATQGFDVTAMDQSAVGLRKAEELARVRGVKVHTEVGDLSTYALGDGIWDVVVAVWCHLPPELRRKVHGEVVTALKPGGMFVLEAYTPAQLAYGTGGPPDAQLLMTLDALRKELAGMEMVRGAEKVREVHEGKYHQGTSAVVQVVARRR